jgi:hypothetical protein
VADVWFFWMLYHVFVRAGDAGANCGKSELLSSYRKACHDHIGISAFDSGLQDACILGDQLEKILTLEAKTRNGRSIAFSLLTLLEMLLEMHLMSIGVNIYAFRFSQMVIPIVGMASAAYFVGMVQSFFDHYYSKPMIAATQEAQKLADGNTVIDKILEQLSENYRDAVKGLLACKPEEPKESTNS